MAVLTSQEVKQNLIRIEPQESYSGRIATQLSETIFGQPIAMKAVARRLALFDTGLGDPDRPLGSMFFLGPSGVGKTETARAALKVMKLPEDRLRIVNMAEYQQDHYIARLVGAPPGYVGFAEEPAIPHAWLHAGRSVIVFDEVDKAHPQIRQALLGILDKGVMDSRTGVKGTQQLHFNNSLLIFTSNIAGAEIHNITAGKQGMGFHKEAPTTSDKAKRIATEAQKGLERALSPEFMNRIDDIVVFEELTDPAIYDRMITKFIDERNGMLTEQRHDDAPYFAVTAEFRQMVLGKGKDKGGRELKRILEEELFDKAADVFMGIDVRRRPLIADFEDGEVNFYTDKIVTVTEVPDINAVIYQEVKKKQIPHPNEPEGLLPSGTGDGTGEESRAHSAGSDTDGSDAGETETDPEVGTDVEETEMEDIRGPKHD